MKKIFAILSAVLIALFSFVGCKEEHTCSFATNWSNNATHHWHACTTASCSQTKDYAPHSFVEGVCVCGKTENTSGGVQPDTVLRQKYNGACNDVATKMGALGTSTNPVLASSSFSKGVRLTAQNQEPTHEEATVQGYIMIKGVTTYIKFLGDMLLNPDFQLTTNAVKFGASFTSPNGTYSETFSATLTYKFDEANDKIEMTWDVLSTMLGSPTPMNIFLYMTIGYDFDTATLTSFHLKSVQSGVAFSAKYDGEVASTWFIHGADIEQYAWYFESEKQALELKSDEAIDLEADFSAEYAVAMITMNPQFAS